jgi:L-histidine N-alpha-methyltransferase
VKNRSAGLSRFEGVHVASTGEDRTLAHEVQEGLRGSPPTLPAKFLYDDAGCALFDRICRTPEYYPTRTELALLAEVAPAIARLTGAMELVELGSGMARKTHVLLDALGAGARPLRYLPFDVSAPAITDSAARLLERYPQLTVRGVVGDFTRDLPAVPRGRGRLVAFLGGTIGNLEEAEAVAFLKATTALLGDDGHLLLAADLVKDAARLHAAYNDAEGLTAAFNLNMVARLGREYGGTLQLADFVHDAFFDAGRSRIEMHARATVATRVTLPSLEVELSLRRGDSIRTEISRKFTPDGLRALLDAAGLELVRLDVAPVPYALALARPRA